MLPQDQKLIRKINKEKARRLAIELQGRRNRDPNLLAISKAIDEYICLDKLKLYCAYLSYTKYTNTEFIDYDRNSFVFLDEVIAQVAAGQFENPLIKIYHWIQQLYEGMDQEGVDDEHLYHQFYPQLSALLQKVSKDERVEVYSYLTNYCTYKINQRITTFLKPFIQFSVLILDIKLTTSGKKDRFLPPATFSNIVKATLRLHDDQQFFTDIIQQLRYSQSTYKEVNSGMEWVEKFVEQYKNRLSMPDADYYYIYSRALLYFWQQQYGKAYRLLNNPKRPQGMFINLETRSLYLVILYELFNKRPAILDSDDVEIGKVLESFRGLIRDDYHRKKQLAEHYLNIYKNFGLLYKRLYKLNLRYDGVLKRPKRFYKLIQTLEQDTHRVNIPFKDWMLSKIGALKANEE
ncbi:MAG: hypothetical protein AAGG75_22780 [Bacteroidota bacterium]